MSMRTKLFAATAAVALVGAITAAPAYASDTSSNSTVGVTITNGLGPRFDTAVAGGASYPSIGNFSPVQMNGSPQLTSAEIAPFTVIDDSGSGAGWQVTLLVPDFSDHLSAPTASHILPAAGVEMNAPVVSQGNADSVMGGVWSTDNNGFTTAKSIVIADPLDGTTHNGPGSPHNGGAPLGPDLATHVAGMGTYLVSPQILKLVVPANAIAAAYTTQATIALIAAP
jgi:hypothetical protein